MNNFNNYWIQRGKLLFDDPEDKLGDFFIALIFCDFIAKRIHAFNKNNPLPRVNVALFRKKAPKFFRTLNLLPAIYFILAHLAPYLPLA